MTFNRRGFCRDLIFKTINHSSTCVQMCSQVIYSSIHSFSHPLSFSLQVFLPSLLPHPDAVGVGVAGGGTGCHGAVTSRVLRYRAGTSQVVALSFMLFYSARFLGCFLLKFFLFFNVKVKPLRKTHMKFLKWNLLSPSLQLHLSSALLQWLPALLHHPRQRI